MPQGRRRHKKESRGFKPWQADHPNKAAVAEQAFASAPDEAAPDLYAQPVLRRPNTPAPPLPDNGPHWSHLAVEGLLDAKPYQYERAWVGSNGSHAPRVSMNRRGKHKGQARAMVRRFSEAPEWDCGRLGHRYLGWRCWSDGVTTVVDSYCRHCGEPDTRTHAVAEPAYTPKWYGEGVTDDDVLARDIHVELDGPEPYGDTYGELIDAVGLAVSPAASAVTLRQTLSSLRRRTAQAVAERRAAFTDARALATASASLGASYAHVAEAIVAGEIAPPLPPRPLPARVAISA